MHEEWQKLIRDWKERLRSPSFWFGWVGTMLVLLLIRVLAQVLGVV
jgi:uncharacterized membrane protein